MGKNLVREFITDEFKMPVQAVLDQALHGEETANFGTYELVEEVHSYLTPYSHPLYSNAIFNRIPTHDEGRCTSRRSIECNNSP